MNGRLSTHDLSTALRIAVARLSRRLRAEKEDHELSDSQTAILAYLVREGSGTIGRLSEYERVTPPSMNRTVNRLEEAGYVERTADQADGRKVVVVPTERGVELVAETRRRRDAWLHQRLRTLSPEQRAILAQAADIIRELAES
ncbi:MULTISPECIES: MarR family transcriptional regulator [unclassified Leifsonia]|uniref:MarR family winged helix-turn-helix transcriptional regulator n=1 Tax=unclassified Leifsonia TaxID=2663824 RepID=UPI0008A7D0AB|nr:MULTISPECIES: MarR family transcriptional regulator [unclassified Leifsonia]SEH59506.1 DNA-binding transcriptional regulator, MarR family [Leifsonia sp. CL154]SFL19609.1 DNA-binding transcriptional regulator, MarR family [Leifsonia sp. CL147]